MEFYNVEMEIKMQGVFTIILLVGLSMPSILLAQSKDEKSSSVEGKESSEELYKKNVGSYLEKYYQTIISENLKSKNLNDIHILDIMVGNFGDQVQGVKADLDAVKKDYQIALRYYYRRAFMLSGKSLKDNERKITEIYKKLSNYYESRTDELLTDCADVIATMEQNESIEPGQEKNSKIKELAQNQLRLKIAYYQMGLADNMNREGRFNDAITFYRLGKEYGIAILSDLKSTESDKKAVMDKYQVDLADNRNRSFNKSKNEPKTEKTSSK
ncbi:MAG: hypothetical protein L6Q54_00210 [Leptospiraceae bacterium]|nr:hypothetical protein [Leptospiraceae bacterium]MCK6379659.1 hypothetical protein [Leptospiraceae bacterium]NUM40113.1 hypothetical protein [Leptospiraceae bacterium]